MSDRQGPPPLSYLAAHAAGDFPLQTDWMAQNKFDNPIVRAVHVTVYTAAFLPIRRNALFLALLWASHFAIDTRRWNDAVPIWYDQALHIIALAVVVEVTSRWGDRDGGDQWR